MRNKFTGIVLSGGASRRMGSDKGLTLYKGKELVQYAIDILTPHCNELIISSNNLDAYEKFGIRVIPDLVKEKGPIGGLYSCLSSSNTMNNFVISCDMPHLTGEVFDRLSAISDSSDIVVPVHRNGYFEPLTGFYSKSIIPHIEFALRNGDYKLINLFNRVRFDTISIEKLEYGDLQFKNFNRPGDLK